MGSVDARTPMIQKPFNVPALQTFLLNMENENVYEGSKIVKFFRDSTVFLTGGTGFLGKVIVNKLFSTCQVSCVYLLVRKKASKCITERLQELLKDPVSK